MLLFYSIHKHYNSSPVASWDSKLSDTSGTTIKYCQKQHVVVFCQLFYAYIHMFYTHIYCFILNIHLDMLLIGCSFFSICDIVGKYAYSDIWNILKSVLHNTNYIECKTKYSQH